MSTGCVARHEAIEGEPGSYFGKDGETIVILLGGGTKKRQSRDIEAAQDHWKHYQKRTA